MNQKQEIRGLTALKGLFIWMIVLHNASLLDGFLEELPGMSYIYLYGGSLGNSMFFILSGFLMSWGYRDRIRDGRIAFGDFLCRRVKKLYPMYVLSNLAALVVSVWQYGVSAINLKKIAFTLLLQAGVLDNTGPYNNPTWFVPVLMVCYGLYYGGTYLTKSATAYRLFLAGGVVAGYYFSGTDLQIPFLFSGNGIGYLNFFIGCALAEIYPMIKMEKSRKSLTQCLLCGGLLAAAYLMLRFGVEIISGGSGTAFAFVICPAVLYLAYEEGLISRVLGWKPLQYLGKISMNVFYWHLVLYIAMWHGFGGMTMLRFVLYLLTVLFVSVLGERLSHKKGTMKV